MLVLSRMRNESIFCLLPDGKQIEVTVIDIRGEKVRIGFTADPEIQIHRKEVLAAIAKQNAKPEDAK